jgi:flagellin-like hook-associated protein FlgL
MRVTQLEINRTLLADLEKLNRNFVDINRQLSSGKKLNFLGDSPIGSHDLVDITEQAQRLDAYAFNVISAAYQLKSSESALNAVYNTFVSIHTLGENAANDPTNKLGRQAELNEILILRDELVSRGNTLVDGVSIFSGTAVNVDRPFYIAQVDEGGHYVLDADGKPVPLDSTDMGTINGLGKVYYAGNEYTNKIPVGDAVEVIAGVSGSQAMGAVFETIDNLIEQIRNSIEKDGEIEKISKALDSFENALNELNTARGEVGVNLGIVERMAAMIESRNVVLTEQRSKIEDANVLEVALKIGQMQTAQNAALSASSAILKQSNLFDTLG